MIRHCFLMLLFLLSKIRISAQDFHPDLSGWDSDIIKTAGKKSKFLFQSKKQSETVFYCNLARMNGALFVKTVLRPYCRFTGDTTYTPYLQSLIGQLNSQKNAQPLKYGLWLSIMAKVHAVKSGIKGRTGHQNFERRLWLTMQFRKGAAENCAYGLLHPLDIVIALLIDEGIPGVGHRKNILDPKFKRIGVGFSRHKTFGTNCVQEFSF
jgi:uncharacterized protein YkwD